MRVFIGLPLPKEICLKLEPLLKKLSGQYPSLKVVKTEGLHFTLFFLGERTPGEVEVLRELLKTCTLPIKPITANLAGLGTFPEKGFMRVVWAGLQKGEQDLITLQQALKAELIQAKIKIEEERSYKPHLTLARNKNLNLPTDPFKELTIPKDDFQLEQLVLFQSILKSSGAQYRILAQRLL